MLQAGAVFYDSHGTILDEFEANLQEIEGAVPDPKTMEWWALQEKSKPGTWTNMRKNLVSAEVAMSRFTNKVININKKLNASPVMVCYPAGYDFTYFYWYLCKFTGKSCLGFSCIDMKTLGANLIQSSYRESAKRNYPKKWFDPKLKHTHGALDDAKEQGHLFWSMVNEMENQWAILNASKTSV